MPWGLSWINNNNADNLDYEGLGPLSNFQLDIVGFLAILGEGSVLANAQVSALSHMIYLPRLLPAPQALLRPTRPSSLPLFNAEVTAVYSGNHKHHVHHTANILLTPDLPAHTVRCVSVVNTTIRSNEEKALTPLRRSRTTWQLAVHKTVTWFTSPSKPIVKANNRGPMALCNLLGCLFSIALFCTSLGFRDAMSLVATLLLSLLSTLVGISNKWELKLPKRPQSSTSDPTPGDVVIRYPNGSFLIVKCTEDVARELFFAPEEIEYRVRNAAIYQLISLVGTLMLMLGVITLANAKLELQFQWAGSYILLNAAYWIAAALPQSMHWDLSGYRIEEQGIEGGPGNANFTDALWKAILITKDVQWIKNGKSAPSTDLWRQWIHDAEAAANSDSLKNYVDDIPDLKYGAAKRGLIYKAPSDWHGKEEYDKLARARPVQTV